MKIAVERMLKNWDYNALVSIEEIVKEIIRVDFAHSDVPMLFADLDDYANNDGTAELEDAGLIELK